MSLTNGRKVTDEEFIKILADYDRQIRRLPAVGYSLELYRTNLTKQDFLNVVQMIKYYAKLYSASWLAVCSSTSSSTAKPSVKRTGERGRPKKYVEGQRVPRHAHLLLVVTREQSAKKTAIRVKGAIDKKFGRKICKVVSLGNGEDSHVYNFISYSVRQADCYRSGGSFDFFHYLNTIEEEEFDS